MPVRARPCPSCSILVKGTNVGTTTSVDGKFSINVPDKNDAELIFSFVGYLPQNVIIGNRSEVNLTLTADQKMLEEVVVIGYGEAINRRDLTARYPR